MLRRERTYAELHAVQARRQGRCCCRCCCCWCCWGRLLHSTAAGCRRAEMRPRGGVPLSDTAVRLQPISSYPPSAPLQDKLDAIDDERQAHAGVWARPQEAGACACHCRSFSACPSLLTSSFPARSSSLPLQAPRPAPRCSTTAIASCTTNWLTWRRRARRSSSEQSGGAVAMAGHSSWQQPEWRVGSGRAEQEHSNTRRRRQSLAGPARA